MQILRRFLVCLRSSIVLTFAVENYGTQLVLGYSNFNVLSKYAIASCFRFPPHVFSVCTLPCETLDPVSCKFILKLQISPMIGTKEVECETVINSKILDMLKSTG